MILRLAVFVLACACGVAYGGAPPPAQTAAMTRVVSDNPPFILYKPSAWTLRQSAVGETLSIAVASPDGQSVAEVTFTDNRRQRLDAQQVLAQRIRELKARHPDLTVTAASACKDTPPSCAEASLAYTAGGTGMRGRFFFHGDPNVSTVRSYRAPASRLPQERALLLDILTNIHVREPRPLKVQFAPRQAADRSLSIELPADWSFLAQKGAIVAAAPQGRAGFVFTVFTVVPKSYGVAPQPGVIVAPYRPPQAFVHDIFAQFKNRQTRVAAWQPDSQATAACPSQIGRQCEVADMQVGWVSPEGVPCMGGFKILNAQPNTAGHWFSIVAGIWGPADDLARHLPVLEHVAKSFSINDAYARGVQRTRPRAPARAAAEDPPGHSGSLQIHRAEPARLRSSLGAQGGLRREMGRLHARQQLLGVGPGRRQGVPDRPLGHPGHLHRHPLRRPSAHLHPFRRPEPGPPVREHARDQQLRAEADESLTRGDRIAQFRQL